MSTHPFLFVHSITVRVDIPTKSMAPTGGDVPRKRPYEISWCKKMNSHEHIFTKRLIAARSFWEMTQRDLADKSGFPPSHISHFESGRRLPSLGNFIKLCDALNCSADFLLGRDYRWKKFGSDKGHP